MANALDAFRAQKEAADQVHARLTEVATLLNRLRVQVDGLVTTELRDALREEQSLLTRAQETISDCHLEADPDAPQSLSSCRFRGVIFATSCFRK
jgi:hypothetical protein